MFPNCRVCWSRFASAATYISAVQYILLVLPDAQHGHTTTCSVLCGRTSWHCCSRTCSSWHTLLILPDAQGSYKTPVLLPACRAAWHCCSTTTQRCPAAWPPSRSWGAAWRSSGRQRARRRHGLWQTTRWALPCSTRTGHAALWELLQGSPKAAPPHKDPQVHRPQAHSRDEPSAQFQSWRISTRALETLHSSGAVAC